MEENVKKQAEEKPEKDEEKDVPKEPQPDEKQKKIDELTAQYNQMREIAARAQADGINYRNWAEREMKRLKAYGSERAVVSLLPVLDNLDRAISSADADAETIKNGVKMVRQNFVNALKALGVVEVEPIGEKFSPIAHDAMGLMPVADKAKDGTVCAVVRKGYSLANKVIRPAMVMVGKYDEPKEEAVPKPEDNSKQESPSKAENEPKQEKKAE